MKKLSAGITLLFASFNLLATTALAEAPKMQMPTNPVGGKPPEGSSPSTKDFSYQLTYQRAFESVVWSIPAVAIYGFVKATEKLGGKDNTVLAYSRPARANAELLTANDVTPYIGGYTDLRNGPVVFEIPAESEKASLYGQIVDHWQVTIANVGPSGLDEGRGGKLLITPPDYEEKIPEGFIHVKSPSYRLSFGFRSIPGPRSSTEKAHEYAKNMKLYYLSELPDPKPTQFIDPSEMRLETLPVYDETYFEDIHAIISVEKSNPRDKVMMGMLASIGIEKGKPFNPSPETKKAMRQAAIDAFHYMRGLFEEAEPEEYYWKDRQWRYSLYSDSNRGFSWENDEIIDIDQRAARPYSWGTFFPNVMPERPATAYLHLVADEAGNLLQAGKTYSLRVPRDMPVEQFWSLIVYDFETMAFIYNPMNRKGLNSIRDLEQMKKNSDGSITLYFGPKAPDGKKNNWIPTAGKRPMPIMRFYSPTDEFYDRTFKLPDVQLLD